MEVKLDKKLDVGYVRLRKGKVSSTAELRPGILVDLDQDGQVLGIEVLSISTLAPMLTAKKSTKKKSA